MDRCWQDTVIFQEFRAFPQVHRVVSFGRHYLTPLLIVVQVGLTGQHRFSRGNYSRTVSTVQIEITFRGGVPQDSRQDISLHATYGIVSFAEFCEQCTYDVRVL